MKDMTVETLNFIILCMGLLFVMAGILLIVGKLDGKRPASIAFGVLMIAWGLLYLSSGNLKAPNPHLRQDVDARHSMRSDMARLPIRGMTLNRAWTAYLPRFPVTRVPR